MCFLLLGARFSRTSVTNYARHLVSLSLAVHFGPLAWHFKTTLWRFWGGEEVTLESSIHYSSTDSAAAAQPPQNVWITNERRLSGVAVGEGYGNVCCPQRVALRKGNASIALIQLLLLHFQLILNFHYSPKKSQAKPSFFPNYCLTLMCPSSLVHTKTHTCTHLRGPFGGLLLIMRLSAAHIFGTICCLITKIIQRGGWGCQGGGVGLLWWPNGKGQA